MVIDITNKCNMDCYHCMNDSNPDGEHMSMDTFHDAVKLMRAMNPTIVLISGGEPTLHPNFTEIVREVIRQFGLKVNGVYANIIVCSNGLWTTDKEKMAEYSKLQVIFQVINDDRYYPIKVSDPGVPFVWYQDNLPGPLFPAGRARNLLTEPNIKPECFNLRSFVKHSGESLVNAVKISEKRNRFCVPVITYEGDIVVGENAFCKPVGNVKSSIIDIENNIRNFKCNQCGTFIALDSELRKIVGEV